MAPQAQSATSHFQGFSPVSWDRSQCHIRPHRPRQASWGRQGLLTAETLLNSHCHWKVGNGRQLGITTHKWLVDHTPSFRDSTPLATVRTLKVANLFLADQPGWNVRKISSLFEPATVCHIQSLELLTSSSVNDVQFWAYTKSGVYSTKSGYNMLLQQQNDICSMTSIIDAKFFRILWRLDIMPKWKLFLWKHWHNGIATSTNLFNRGLSGSSECPIRLHDFEEVSHLFRFCPLALEAWEKGPLQVHNHRSLHLPFKDWLGYWLHHLSAADPINGSGLPSYVGTLWAIWKLRNSQVFRHQRPTTRLIDFELQESLRRHGIFVQNSYDATRNPLDPSFSPGFQVAFIGQQVSGTPLLTFQISGIRRKNGFLEVLLGWAFFIIAHLSYLMARLLIGQPPFYQ